MTTNLIIRDNIIYFMWQYWFFDLISLLALVMDEYTNTRTQKKAKTPNGLCGLIINKASENDILEPKF